MHRTAAAAPVRAEPTLCSRLPVLVERLAMAGLMARAARPVALPWPKTLCRRLLGWPASETGTLCRVDEDQERGDRLRRAFMLPIL